MHGIVFAALRDFLATHLDQERADAVFGVEAPYLMTAAHPDADFLRLVERARLGADEPMPDFLRAFGVFTGERTFPRLYPAFYDVAGDGRTFLLTIEDRIHELIRATVPDATPPQLHVEAAGDHELRVEYDSPRRLCSFLHGLVEGTAAHYDETVDVAQESCVWRGDPICVFAIGFASDTDAGSI